MAKKSKKEFEKKDEILNEQPQLEEKVIYEAEVGETEGEGTIGDETLSVEELKEAVENNEKDFGTEETVIEVKSCADTKEIAEEKPKIENKNKIKPQIPTTMEMFGYNWMGQIYSE